MNPKAGFVRKAAKWAAVGCVLEGDLKTALAGGKHALLELVMATHAGNTTRRLIFVNVFKSNATQ
jgi:hypothetical protein